MCAESNSKEEIDINFLDVIKILQKNKIEYWICHGTLLGIIRDKKLIPWDHDIDIAVWHGSVSRDKIKKLMLLNGFVLKQKYLEDASIAFTRAGGKQVDINFYKTTTLKNDKKIAYASYYIPKNFFCKMIDALSNAKKYRGRFQYLINTFSIFESLFEKLKIFLIRKKFFYGHACITHPLNVVDEFKNFNFYNNMIIVPKKIEEYLVYMYGKNWRNPKKKYNTVKDNHSTIYYL